MNRPLLKLRNSHRAFGGLWLGLFWLSSLAIAQQYSSSLGEGRALDRNLQVGSGYVNPPVGLPDYRIRNDLVTGNVPGLGYFRDTIGYRAPGEFRGRLSDDTLFRFRAVSSGPTVLYPTYSSSFTSSGAPSGYSLYRALSPGSGTSSITTPFSSLNLITPSIDIRSIPTQTGQLSGIQYYPTTGLLWSPSPSTGTWNLGELTDLQPSTSTPSLEISASPLLGLRQVTRPESIALAMGLQAARQKASPPPPQEKPEPSSRVRLDSSLSSTAPDTSAQSLASRGRWPEPGLALGAQIQAALENRTIDTAQPLAERIQQIEKQLLEPLDWSSAQPGDDVYMDLLRRLQSRRTGTGEQAETQTALAVSEHRPLQALSKPSTTPTTPSQPGHATGAVPGSAHIPVRPATEPEKAALTTEAPELATFTPPQHPFDQGRPTVQLAKPTTEQLAMARQELALAMSRARGLTVSPPQPQLPTEPESTSTPQPPTPGQTTDQTAQEQPLGPRQPLPESLSQLIEALRYTGPGLASLAGRKDTLINQLLRRAEADLTAESYFEAENKYRAVLDLAPDHALAQAGLIHAQLGAGLIRSAATNLRRLFARHPEVIALKYQSNLLPAPGRLQWMQRQLDEMISYSRQPEPCLLLAYLGYQFDVPELVQYGLDLAQARSPHDPLWPILRQLWLSSPSLPVSPKSQEPTVTPPVSSQAK